MIYAIIITAAASGWAIYQTVANRALVREVYALEQVYSFASDNADRFADALQALRSRCFITNERGEATRRHCLAVCPDDDYALVQTDTDHFSAGCRTNLTRAQALKHWNRTDERAKLFTAAIEEAVL